MTESRSGEVVLVVGGHPAREPDATCEGCGARGTVGRATRHSGEQGRVVEQHRYCARCWPEWSAFYRARWEDESRRASLAWRDLPREDRDTPPPPPRGMSFETATWHPMIELVRALTLQARALNAPPPTAEARARFVEHVARVAADIRRGALEREGPMPIEVRAFLAEFDHGPAFDPPAG
jgi:hypothetical protein